MTIKITVHKPYEADLQSGERSNRITIRKPDEWDTRPAERETRVTAPQHEEREDQHDEAGNRTKRLLAIVASAGTLVLIAAIVLVALQPWSSSVHATPDQTVTITLHNMHFVADRPSVAAGQPVTIVLENHDTMNHQFAIDALGVSSPVVGPGGTTSVTFTPSSPGDYEYRCPMPGHADLGLVGTLHVTQ